MKMQCRQKNINKPWFFSQVFLFRLALCFCINIIFLPVNEILPELSITLSSP